MFWVEHYNLTSFHSDPWRSCSNVLSSQFNSIITDVMRNIAVQQVQTLVFFSEGAGFRSACGPDFMAKAFSPPFNPLKYVRIF